MDDGRTARVFAFAWASAHVIHAWHQGGSGLEGALADLWLAPVLVAALAVLLRPSSPHRLAVLAGAQLLAFGAQLPFVANHWTIAAFVNAGLLAAYLPTAVARGNGRDLVATTAPYARAIFLIAYGAAAVAKLNTTFLDPAHSCALFTIEPVAAWLGFGVPSGTGTRTAIIWGVALVEFAVPALLLWKRTRFAGIGLAAVFHLALAATPVVLVMDFTAYVLALLVLFAPGDIGARLADEAETFARRRPGAARLARRVGPAARYGAAGAVVVLAAGRSAVLAPVAWASVTWMAFLLYGIITVTLGLALLHRYRSVRSWPAPVGAGLGLATAHRVLVVILLLNAASPYLGLKTTSSFTMFSNLRTEAQATNHLLLPRAGWFDYQDDLVAVLDSTHPDLTAIAGSDQLLAYHELRRAMRERPEAAVTYRRGGEVVRAERASDIPELVSLSLPERKLLHFRSVTADGNAACQP